MEVTEGRSGWVVTEEQDLIVEGEDGGSPVLLKVTLAGPFLSRDEAVVAAERERLARLVEQRAKRMDKYAESYNREEAECAMTIAHGLRMAAEIVRLGACPHCAGSAAELGGRRKGSSLQCRVCGADHTDYSKAVKATG